MTEDIVEEDGVTGRYDSDGTASTIGSSVSKSGTHYQGSGQSFKFKREGSGKSLSKSLNGPASEVSTGGDDYDDDFEEEDDDDDDMVDEVDGPDGPYTGASGASLGVSSSDSIRMDQAARQLRQMATGEAARLANDPSALTTTDLLARERRAKQRLDRANELLAHKKVKHERRERERALLRTEKEANALLDAALHYDGTTTTTAAAADVAPGSSGGGRPPGAQPSGRQGGGAGSVGGRGEDAVYDGSIAEDSQGFGAASASTAEMSIMEEGDFDDDLVRRGGGAGGSVDAVGGVGAAGGVEDESATQGYGSDTFMDESMRSEMRSEIRSEINVNNTGNNTTGGGRGKGVAAGAAAGVSFATSVEAGDLSGTYGYGDESFDAESMAASAAASAALGALNSATSAIKRPGVG